MTYEAFMIKEQFLIHPATYHSMYYDEYDEYKFTILACFQNFVTTLFLKSDHWFGIMHWSELKSKWLPLDTHTHAHIYIHTYTNTEVCISLTETFFWPSNRDDQLIWRQSENSTTLQAPKKIWNKTLLLEIADSFGYNLII